jgi:hypothetical protein
VHELATAEVGHESDGSAEDADDRDDLGGRTLEKGVTKH